MSFMEYDPRAKISLFSIRADDKPGVGAEILKNFAEFGVNVV